MNNPPKKKEITIHGHKRCPECMKIGYNQACEEWEEWVIFLNALKKNGIGERSKIMTPTGLWDIYYHAIKEWIPKATDKEVREHVDVLLKLSMQEAVKYTQPIEGTPERGQKKY